MALRGTVIRWKKDCLSPAIQGDSMRPNTALQVTTPRLKSRARSTAARAASSRSRTALADFTGSGATYLDHSNQLHGMIANSSRVFQPPGK